MKKPILAIISREIRREDLQEPLQYFRRFRPVHFWQKAGYGDMRSREFSGSNLFQFTKFGQLPALLEKLNPDILQIPDPFASRSTPLLGGILLKYARRKPRLKIVVPIFENRPIRIKFGPLAGRFVEGFARKLAARTDLFVALNQGARKNLKKIGADPAQITSDILWGTWGVDTREFAPTASRAKPKTSGADVLFVGKISVAKGIPWLLKALAKARQKLPRVQLSLYGPVEQKQLLAQIKQTPGAKYSGIIKNARLPARMSRANLVVAPSVTTLVWQEQVGMVNLQALSCAVPVVSTRSGAIPDYIGGSGACILVPERDETKLAQAIIKVLKNPIRARAMGRKGRKWVDKRYEVRKSIAKIEQKLEEVLGV